jgi:hypothetical protein
MVWNSPDSAPKNVHECTFFGALNPSMFLKALVEKNIVPDAFYKPKFPIVSTAEYRKDRTKRINKITFLTCRKFFFNLLKLSTEKGLWYVRIVIPNINSRFEIKKFLKVCNDLKV